MATYFADSSALAKIYVHEPGSSWMQALLPTAERFYIGRIAVVELASIFARRVREGRMDAAEQGAAIRLFRDHLIDYYDVTELSEITADSAASIAGRHNLRALDALQLAFALSVNEVRLRAGLLPMTFLSSDLRLNAATNAEGLQVDDPNQHP